MGKQVNKYGYQERSTKVMLNKPITKLSRFVGMHWYLGAERLSKEANVPLKSAYNAIAGGAVPDVYEKKIRKFLGSL